MGHSTSAVSVRILMLVITMLAAMVLCAPAAWADDGQVAESDGQDSTVLAETPDGEASAADDAAEADVPAQGSSEETQGESGTDGGAAPAAELPESGAANVELAGNEAPETPVIPETPQPDADVQEQVAHTEPAADVQPAVAPTATPATPAKRASSADATANDANEGEPAGTNEEPVPEVDPARTVADGVYWIASSQNAKQAIVVSKKSKKSGASMKLEKKTKGQAYQKWQFTWKNGYYEIVNLNSGKALAVSAKKSGAKVVQVKRANSTKQRWSVTLAKDGKTYIIKNAWSGKVLNLNGSAKTGTTITALKANKKDSQTFKLKKSNIIDAGAYQLFTALSKKYVLYTPKAKKGTQLAIAKKNSTKLNQRFYVRNEANGAISIQSVATGMFVADVNGKAVLMPWSDSDKTLLWDCSYATGVKFLNASTGKTMLVSGGKAESKAGVETGTPGSAKAKKWKYLSKPLIAENTYSIKAASGAVVEVAKGSYVRGANVRTAAEASKAGSQCFEVQSEGKYFRLVNTRTYQAIAVKDASKEAGANVVQAPVSSKKAQLWKATIDRDGTITFVNARSKMALQLSGKKNNVNQGNPSASASQAFKLKPMKRYSLSGNTTLDKNVARILSMYTSLRSCFSYVTHFSYREGARFYSGPHYLSEATTISYANDMVAHHSGNCYRFASLFSWLARGLGYSSKVANGHVPSASGGLAPHGWTWIYTNKGTYICDPDLNHEMPGHNWYMTSVGGAPTSYGYW